MFVVFLSFRFKKIQQLIKSKQTGEGTSFGLLKGELIDELTFRLKEISVLDVYTAEKQSSETLSQFSEKAMKAALNEVEKGADGVIGWFQSNLGLGCSLSDEIIKARKEINSKDLNKLKIQAEDLLLVIDVLKTNSKLSYPCMEFYNLKLLLNNDSAASDAALPFTLY